MNRTEQQKALAWKNVDRSRARFGNEYERRFLNALNSQLAPVIAAVQRGKEKPENYVVELPIQNVYSELYPKVGVHFARESYRSLKAAGIDYNTKADEPENDWLRFMRRYVTEKAGEKIKSIADTTRKFVRGVLDKAVEQGLSIENTANLLVSEARGINKTRAKLISRTEIISASNSGSLIGAQSTGLKMNKVWLATPNERTRATHRAADGQAVALDGKFTVGSSKMEYPGDSTAPAEEVIACRCTIVYDPI